MSSSYSRIAGTGPSEAFLLGVDQSFHQNARCEQARAVLNAFAGQNAKGHWLGGSRTQFVFAAAETIVPEWEDVVINWTALQGLTVQARVEIWTDSASTSVTPRIKNVTDSANFDGSSLSVATTWTERIITITPPGVIGIKRYRFYLVPANASNGVAGIGSIEIFDASLP